MNCSEARERILSSSIDDLVRSHIRDCEFCAELAAKDGRLARALGLAVAPAAPAGGFDKLAAVTAEHDANAIWRLRSMPTSQRVVLAVVAATIAAVLTVLFSRRPDWDAYPMMQMGLVLASMLIAAGFGIVLSMPKLYEPERPMVVRLSLFLFLLAVPFLPALLPVPETTAVMSGDFLSMASKCMSFGTLASFPALLTLRALQRDRTWALWPTMFAALAAAIGANMALQVHCPVGDPLHLAFSHATLGVLYAALAWAIVRITVR